MATSGLLAGCGLAQNGLLEIGADGGGTDSSSKTDAPDATVAEAGPPADASLPGDANVPDGSVTPDDAASIADAGPADSACPSPSNDAAVSVITSIAAPPTIDGNLTDWGCGPWIELNDSNAAYTRVDGQTISGEFAVRWDANNVYVGAHIVVPTLQGTNTTEPYVNDAFEIYLSGDSPLTGDYDKLSHQYIVDWHNLVVDYGPSNYGSMEAVTSPPSFTSAVMVVSGGWQVEAAIGWSALEDNSKAPGTGASIGVDVELDDGDGVTLNTQVLAILAAHSSTCGCKTCCCGEATDYPNCDTLCFGGATLQ